MFSLARDWFQKSGRKNAIPREVLEQEFEQVMALKAEGMATFAENPIEPSWLVKKLQGTYLQKATQDRIEKAARDGDFDADLDYEEMVERNNILVHDLLTISINSKPEKPLAPMSDASNLPAFIEENLSRLARIQAGEIPEAVTFGFAAIDAAYQGLREDEFAVVAAFTKVGKSYILCKQALTAANQGKKVVLFSLENSEELTYARLTALAGRLPMSRVSDATLPPGQRDVFRALVGEEVFDRIYVLNPRSRSSRVMEELYYQAYSVNADVLIGDQLSHVENPGRWDSDWRMMGDNAQKAKVLTMETRIPSIWAAQLNRGASKKKTPDMSNMARSLGIGQEADWVFFLSKEDLPNRRILNCDTARRGEEKKWSLAFEFDPMVIEVLREVTT
jgi:replicative DNA helicase